MTDHIVLTEYEDRPVALERDDAGFILSRLGGRISVRRELRGGAYVLNPRQHVGIVTLPSGRRLECRPKVPIGNLFVMLAAAFDLPDPFWDAPAAVDRLDVLLDFVVARFTTMLAERLDLGLYRAYVDREANLDTIRGRILLVEDLRRNLILRHRTYCRHTVYAWDVPENQVLRQVVQLLGGWVRDAELRRRLWTLDARLEEVTPSSFVAADLDRFVYHRLNADYRPLHRLCRLFLDGASPSARAGPVPFAAFLLDMNRLFEAFVTRALRRRAPAGWAVDAQRTVYLDRGHAVAMRPDLLVRQEDQIVLVGDLKYKRLDPGQHRHHDLYQVLAYCTALGADCAVLVYPRHLVPVATTVRIRHAELTIREVSIDVGGDQHDLETAADRLAELVFAPLAGPEPHRVPPPLNSRRRHH